MGEYDKSSTWLIQHHGDSILRLGGVRGILSWRARQAKNLLAVTQILAGMRYNDAKLFQILGGQEAMIESPVLQEFVAKGQRKSIMVFLIARFGPAARTVGPALDLITDEEKLDGLTELAAKCPDLETFETEISSQD
jgi:hypothetical protein